MVPITHQTARLSAGSHRSPREGTCVMELASMLAGEPFTDHPASVSPIIGAFLRTYNDGVDDERRQDLYLCASLVVGSGGDEDAERRRLHRLREEISEVRSQHGAVGRLLLGPRTPRGTPTDVATATARMLLAHGEGGHERALSLVSDLVAFGTRETAASGAPESAPIVVA